MASLDLFQQLLAPLCPEAPEPLMRSALLRAAQNFCQRTNIHQDLATASAREGVGEYAVDTPSTQVMVHQLMAVFYKERPLNLVGSLDVRLPTALRGDVADVVTEVGDPTDAYFKTPSGDAFWLYPLPAADVAGALTVRASFSPKLTATTLDDVLYDTWSDAIVSGAAARLMAMPRQPYSSPQAPVHEAAFERAVLRAKRDAQMGRVKSSTAVRPRLFA